MRHQPLGGSSTSVAADTRTISIRRPQAAVRVTTPDGTPIVGAKVDVGSVLWELTPFRVVFTKETDGNGYVYLDGLLPGGYLIHAYKLDLQVQGTPAGISVDLLGKATPDNLQIKLHGAPWYYTLTVTYPEVIGVAAAQIMAKMLEIERDYFGAHFDEVRVVGASVEIDFHLTAGSPFVITSGIVLAILVGLGILIILGVIAWILKERYIPPTQKGEGQFEAPDGSKFNDQASLAQYLTSKKDPKPYMCAYQGCNLRFTTESEKLAHMETFHKAELPWGTIAIAVALTIIGIVVLPKVFGGPQVMALYHPEERERKP